MVVLQSEIRCDMRADERNVAMAGARNPDVEASGWNRKGILLPGLHSETIALFG